MKRAAGNIGKTAQGIFPGRTQHVPLSVKYMRPPARQGGPVVPASNASRTQLTLAQGANNKV